MKLSILAFLLVVLAIPLICTAQTNVLSHPFLLVNATEVAQIKKDLKDSSWKIKAWKKLKENADAFLDERLEVPPRGGNWEQNYIDTLTGDELKRGKPQLGARM